MAFPAVATTNIFNQASSTDHAMRLGFETITATCGGLAVILGKPAEQD